jgi:hypothetical protein
MVAPQTYVSSRPQWSKTASRQQELAAAKISSYDDDAEHEPYALLLLLSQGVGARISES